jgi:phage FluMu gp28-like protein
VLELRNVPFKEQEFILYFILDRLPRFTHGCFDARGNGQYLAERAMQKYGMERITQVMLSESWYREEMPRFKSFFEDGTIEVAADADHMDDYRAIKMIKGVAKLPDVRTTDKTGKKRHGDAAIGGAMAVAATRVDVREYAYHPITKEEIQDMPRPIRATAGFGRLKGAW